MSPRYPHTLIMHSSKPWLMLLNKVSLFLPKSGPIQKRLERTMVAKYTTKTAVVLTTLLPFHPPYQRPKLERRSSQKCLCFFVRTSSESQHSPGIGWDWLRKVSLFLCKSTSRVGIVRLGDRPLAKCPTNTTFSLFKSINFSLYLFFVYLLLFEQTITTLIHSMTLFFSY